MIERPIARASQRPARILLSPQEFGGLVPPTFNEQHCTLFEQALSRHEGPGGYEAYLVLRCGVRNTPHMIAQYAD